MRIIITPDLFFLSGMLCCAVLFFFIIWISGKSIGSKILCSLCLCLVSFFLFSFGIGDSPHFMEGKVRALLSSLRSVLDNEKPPLPDSVLAEALKHQNISKIALELEVLCRHPNNHPFHRNDTIDLPPEERKPDVRIYRQFPSGTGKTEFLQVAAARIKQLKRQTANKYWQGKGVIVIGQLRVEGNDSIAGVASRTFLFPNGVFAHAMYPGPDRELQFFKSGYDPLAIWLDPSKEYPECLDLGEILLKKSKKTFPLTFTLHLPGPATTAEIHLRNAFPAPTWRSWGYECSAPVQTTVIRKLVADGEYVSVDGLSAIPYELVMEAPGYIRRTFYFTGDHPLHLGDITLQPARRQTFRQRPFSGGLWESVTLKLDGTTSLVVGPKDSFGNIVGIELTPDRASDRILAFFPWHPVYFDDYGETLPETTPLPKPLLWEGTLFLQPGHLYRMKCAQKKIDKFIYLEPAVKEHGNFR